jgi:hypothetical protein
MFVHFPAGENLLQPSSGVGAPPDYGLWCSVQSAKATVSRTVSTKRIQRIVEKIERAFCRENSAPHLEQRYRGGSLKWNNHARKKPPIRMDSIDGSLLRKRSEQAPLPHRGQFLIIVTSARIG